EDRPVADLDSGVCPTNKRGRDHPADENRVRPDPDASVVTHDHFPTRVHVLPTLTGPQIPRCSENLEAREKLADEPRVSRDLRSDLIGYALVGAQTRVRGPAETSRDDRRGGYLRTGRHPGARKEDRMVADLRVFADHDGPRGWKSILVVQRMEVVIHDFHEPADPSGPADRD